MTGGAGGGTMEVFVDPTRFAATATGAQLRDLAVAGGLWTDGTVSSDGSHVVTRDLPRRRRTVLRGC